MDEADVVPGHRRRPRRPGALNGLTALTKNQAGVRAGPGARVSVAARSGDLHPLCQKETHGYRVKCTFRKRYRMQDVMAGPGRLACSHRHPARGAVPTLFSVPVLFRWDRQSWSGGTLDAPSHAGRRVPAAGAATG